MNAPITLISGEEIVLALAARQQWRERAQADGFTERRRHDSEELDWTQLPHWMQGGGLFASKSCIEIHGEELRSLPTPAQKVLPSLPASDDVCLLLFLPRLEKAEQSAWFRALAGRIQHQHFKKLQGRDVEIQIEQRLRQLGLSLQPEALQLLWQSCANHLGAAWQIMEALRWQPQKSIDVPTLQAFLTQEALYQSHVLGDALLLGDWPRAWFLLQQQRQSSDSERMKVQLLLTAQLQKDASILLNLLSSSRQEDLSACLKAYRIPNFKHRHYYQARQKHRPKTLQALLRLCARLDAINKGSMHGDYWLTLGHYLLFRWRHG